jgi:hypothetical protein
MEQHPGLAIGGSESVAEEVCRPGLVSKPLGTEESECGMGPQTAGLQKHGAARIHQGSAKEAMGERGATR